MDAAALMKKPDIRVTERRRSTLTCRTVPTQTARLELVVKDGHAEVRKIRRPQFRRPKRDELMIKKPMDEFLRNYEEAQRRVYSTTFQKRPPRFHMSAEEICPLKIVLRHLTRAARSQRRTD